MRTVSSLCLLIMLWPHRKRRHSVRSSKWSGIWVKASAEQAARDDIDELTTRIDALDGKLAGINRRLDTEELYRADLKIAHR
jgi:hypothetical protein